MGIAYQADNMKIPRKYFSEIGKIGRSKCSDAQKEASRLNGAKGGRPRKIKSVGNLDAIVK